MVHHCCKAGSGSLVRYQYC